MRVGDLYGVWRFYDPSHAGRVFRYTYSNSESATVRGTDGFKANDYGLDLIEYSDGHREWKDVEHLHGQLREGRTPQKWSSRTGCVRKGDR